LEKELINEKVVVENIYNEIKDLIMASRARVYNTVNVEMLNLHWSIGKIILEIQEGKERAKYGEEVLKNISLRLTNEFGKGYSVQNLRRMRQFYNLFPIRSTVMSELSWSHYLEIIKIDENNKRNFYMHEAINSRWSVRELQRQKDSLLYERLILSKDKKEVLKLSKEDQTDSRGKKRNWKGRRLRKQEGKGRRWAYHSFGPHQLGF